MDWLRVYLLNTCKNLLYMINYRLILKAKINEAVHSYKQP